MRLHLDSEPPAQTRVSEPPAVPLRDTQGRTLEEAQAEDAAWRAEQAKTRRRRQAWLRRGRRAWGVDYPAWVIAGGVGYFFAWKFVEALWPASLEAFQRACGNLFWLALLAPLLVLPVIRFALRCLNRQAGSLGLQTHAVPPAPEPGESGTEKLDPPRG